MDAKARPCGCDYTAGTFIRSGKELSANVPAYSNHNNPDRLLPTGRGISEIVELPKARQMLLELVINHISCLKLLLSVLIIIKIN